MLLNFDDIKNSIIEGDAISVLLGNGFSQSWNAGIFNYKNLFERADFGARHEAIKNIFSKLNTFDFESAMEKMLATASILEEYDPTHVLIPQIRDDAERLKEALITAIATTHPSRPSEVARDGYRSCREFLQFFDEIYTVNYDLLMYWARNQNELEPEGFRSDDGFRVEQKWRSHGTNQNIFFLHGALHLFDTKISVKKHVYKTDGETIIDQVRNNLRENKFPLFVSEPSSTQKEAKILHNQYLTFCFEQLGMLTGTLIIYGHSLDASDKHIFDRIKSSRVNNIYVSLFGPENSEENLRTQANARTYLGKPTISVKFFDATTVPLWK
ncbi:DUF4917 family protein [Herbaspirillum chlorophenolicum]|uniref:DUF4917 family protein n=1 Tax=Herbaspirillum chlorophenolicum TaxID=211589 RepID=A0ABW8F4N5_9BURK